MKIIEEHNYGADADGNRGIHIKFYDLEPSDEPEIIKAIKNKLIGYDECDYPETVTITLTAPDDEEIDFEVDVKDFL